MWRCHAIRLQRSVPGDGLLSFPCRDHGNRPCHQLCNSLHANYEEQENALHMKNGLHTNTATRSGKLASKKKALKGLIRPLIYCP